MDNGKFVELAKALVSNYYATSAEAQDTVQGKKRAFDYYHGVNVNTIYVVWLSKTLQNNKALLSAPVSDGRYFEVTYNGDKEEFYVDTYVKENNTVVSKQIANNIWLKQSD